MIRGADGKDIFCCWLGAPRKKAVASPNSPVNHFIHTLPTIVVLILLYYLLLNYFSINAKVSVIFFIVDQFNMVSVGPLHNVEQLDAEPYFRNDHLKLYLYLSLLI